MNIYKLPVKSAQKSDTRTWDNIYKTARHEHKTLCFNERDGRIPDEIMNILIGAWMKLYGGKK